MHRDPPDYDCAYVHADGSSAENIALLLKWLDVKNPRELLIVANSARSLRANDTIDRLTRRGVRSTHHRARGWRPDDRAVLALWLDDAQLSDIEHTGRRIALEPWQLSKCDIWRLARSPQELSGVELDETDLLHPVVRKAMDSISLASNPADGLVSYGKDLAVSAFRELRGAGYTWDSAECAAIMARGGWRISSADALKTLANEMLQGKNKRTSGHHAEIDADHIRRWEAETKTGRLFSQ